MKDEFISIRVERVRNVRELQAAAAHASRLDRTSIKRLRPGADSSLNFHYRPWVSEPRPGAVPIDYVADFENMLRRRGVPVRSNAAPIAHCIVQVSPGWIRKAGDLHDPENRRNRQFFDFSISFAKRAFGEASVLAARMDHDETGGGTVDVLVCAEARTKTNKPFLSISPALRRIQKNYPESRNTFSALQDAIAEYAHAHLDPNLKRGKLKEGRAPDRLTPENYAARKVNEHRRRRLAAIRVGVKGQRAQLKAEALDLEQRTADLYRLTESLDHREQALRAREAAVASRELDLIERERAVNERGENLELREKAIAADRASLIDRQSETERQVDNAERLLETVRDLQRQADSRAEELAARQRKIGLLPVSWTPRKGVS